MRIKKLTAVLLSAVMAISMCACAKEEKKPPFDEAAYLDKIAEEVTGKQAELSYDEALLELYISEPTVTEMSEKYRGAKIDTSKDYYEIDIESLTYDDIMKALSEGLAGDDDIPALSEAAKDYFKNRFYGTIVGLCNAQKGQYELVFSSLISYGRTYVPEEPVSSRARIYPTDKDICYYVTYVGGEDGALSVSVSYLFFDEKMEELLKGMFGDNFKKISK